MRLIIHVLLLTFAFVVGRMSADWLAPKLFPGDESQRGFAYKAVEFVIAIAISAAIIGMIYALGYWV